MTSIIFLGSVSPDSLAAWLAHDSDTPVLPSSPSNAVPENPTAEKDA